MKKWVALLAVLSAAWLAVMPQSVHAAAEAEEAAVSDMPYITLLDSFKLYTSRDAKSGETDGALSALQSVRLAPIPRDQLMSIPQMDVIPVETWLGTRWLHLKEGAYKYGRLETAEPKITLLDDTELYNYTSTASSAGAMLSSQQVDVLGAITTCEPYTPCSSPNGKWFLIHTSWLGDKWILPYRYAEKYKGEPVAGSIALMEEAPVYRYPFDQEPAEEPVVKPQLLQPKAKYTEVSRMVPPSVWYPVDTPSGLRWIYYGTGAYEGVEPVELQLELPVAFQYYSSPALYMAEQLAQPPQTLHAVGRWNRSWYFVLADGKGHWVNPAQEIASHLTGDFAHDEQLGVKLTDARVQLSDTSVGYTMPYIDSSQVTGTVLTFTKQEAGASRMWTSPNGDTWYYIHTWQGPMWVLP